MYAFTLFALQIFKVSQLFLQLILSAFILFVSLFYLPLQKFNLFGLFILELPYPNFLFR